MSGATLVSVGEYLVTCYRPDRDYVDGQLLERNVGEWEHSRLQIVLGSFFLQHEKALGLLSVTEQSIQVSEHRYRVPDISVIRGKAEKIITRPPFLCIEILSPEDSMSSMHERIDDYLVFGVENIWILDPVRQKALWVDANGMHQADNSILETSGAPIRVDLNAFWPQST